MNEVDMNGDTDNSEPMEDEPAQVKDPSDVEPILESANNQMPSQEESQDSNNCIDDTNTHPAKMEDEKDVTPETPEESVSITADADEEKSSRSSPVSDKDTRRMRSRSRMSILKRKNSVSSTRESSVQEKRPRLENKWAIPANKDKFCWMCHKEEATASCTNCPRSFHTKCCRGYSHANSSWLCSICLDIRRAENPTTRSASMRKLTQEKLNELLKFALKRMKSVPQTAPFMHPVDTEILTDYTDYVVQPVDLSLLQENVQKCLYGSTEAFFADARWIVHNSMVYNSQKSQLTNVAKNIVKTCKNEMVEIETCCECYLNANTKPDTWFIEVCSTPHVLVWAKLKGFPFWPAKVVDYNESQQMCDVRFFGQHDKAWVPNKVVFLFSIKDPNSTAKSQTVISRAVSETQEHIAKLREKFGTFNYAPFRLGFVGDPQERERQLHLMLPEYDFTKNQTVIDCGLKTKRVLKTYAELNDPEEEKADENGCDELEKSENVEKASYEVTVKESTGDDYQRHKEVKVLILKKTDRKLDGKKDPVAVKVVVDKKIDKPGETAPQRSQFRLILPKPDLEKSSEKNQKLSETTNKQNKPKTSANEPCKTVEKINNKEKIAEKSIKDPEPDDAASDKVKNIVEVNTLVESDQEIEIPPIMKSLNMIRTPTHKRIELNMQKITPERENVPAKKNGVKTYAKSRSPPTNVPIEKLEFRDVTVTQTRKPIVNDTVNGAMIPEIIIKQEIDSDEEVDEGRTRSEMRVFTPGELNKRLDSSNQLKQRARKSFPNRAQRPIAPAVQTPATKPIDKTPVAAKPNITFKPIAPAKPNNQVQKVVTSQQGGNTSSVHLNASSAPGLIAMINQQKLSALCIPQNMFNAAIQQNSTENKTSNSATLVPIMTISSNSTVTTPSTNHPLSAISVQPVNTPAHPSESEDSLPTLRPRPDFKPFTPSTVLPKDLFKSDPLSSMAQQLTCYFKDVFNLFVNEAAQSGNLDSLVRSTQMEVVDLKRKYEEDVNRLKFEMNALKQSFASERAELVSKYEKALDDAKLKSWCNYCKKEANYYCCWNTSYCDFNCLRAHWPLHKPTCTNDSIPKKPDVLAVKKPATTAVISTANSTVNKQFSSMQIRQQKNVPPGKSTVINLSTNQSNATNQPLPQLTLIHSGDSAILSKLGNRPVGSSSGNNRYIHLDYSNQHQK